MDLPASKSHPIVRIQGGHAERVEDAVAVETAVTFFVNGREVATLLCSPSHIEALAVGFLLGEGVLRHREELLDVAFDRGRGTVQVTVTDAVDLSPFSGGRSGTFTSGCGKGRTYTFIRDVETLPPVVSDLALTPAAIAAKVRDFMHRSETYRDTGGVHSALLWDGRSPAGDLAFCEDLGRHNAVDKVFGRCLLEGRTAAGGVLLTSGRISSEIALKCARAGVPVAISRNAPTSFSVALAGVLDLTLVGFVRGDRMNVYTCPWRIVGA